MNPPKFTSAGRPELDRVIIVLVEPQFPGNIGASCRAMKNMGLSRLRVIQPPQDRENDAYKMAHGARDILENIEVFYNLEDAIKDCALVVGTTARLGGWRNTSQSPRAAAANLLEIAQTDTIAILFGSEDRGLTNDHIRFCQRLLTIPTSSEMSSLNVSQAVLTIAYELFTSDAPKTSSGQKKYATNDQIMGMADDFCEALQMIDFMRPGDPEYWMIPMKRLWGRACLDPREVNMFRGIARQIRWLHSKVEKNRPQDEEGLTD